MGLLHPSTGSTGQQPWHSHQHAVRFLSRRRTALFFTHQNSTNSSSLTYPTPPKRNNSPSSCPAQQPPIVHSLTARFFGILRPRHSRKIVAKFRAEPQRKGEATGKVLIFAKPTTKLGAQQAKVLRKCKKPLRLFTHRAFLARTKGQKRREKGKSTWEARYFCSHVDHFST